MDSRFSMSELVDLALLVPEVGAVNFNILHTVLKAMLVEMDIGHLKTPCLIRDPTAAQAAVTKAKMMAPPGPVRKGVWRKGAVRKGAKRKGAERKGAEQMDAERIGEEMMGEERMGAERMGEERMDAERMGEERMGAERMDAERMGEERMGAERMDSERMDAERRTAKKDINDHDDDSEVKGIESEQSDEEIDFIDYFEEEDDTALPPLTDSSCSSSSSISIDLSRPSRVTQRSGVETVEVDALPDAEDLLQRVDAAVMALSLDGVPSAEIREVTVSRSQKYPPLPGRPDRQPFQRSSKGRVIDGEELLKTDPVKLMTEMWRATNLNRRMDGVEHGISELSSVLDLVVDRLRHLEVESEELVRKSESGDQEVVEKQQEMEEKCLTLQRQVANSHEELRQGILKSEEILTAFSETQEKRNEVFKEKYQKMTVELAQLSSSVVTKEDYEQLKHTLTRTLDDKLKFARQTMKELKDSVVSREDFGEMTARIDVLEETKIDREELGKLLQEGFVDLVLEEISKLKDDLKALEEKHSTTEDNLEHLTHQVSEEMAKVIESQHRELTEAIELMNKKLKTLDAEEIYDLIAKLEDQDDMVLDSIDELKTTSEQIEKEVKSKLRKMDFILSAVKILKDSKADINKVKDLLDAKADVEVLMDKLDTKEFFTVMNETRHVIDRLMVKQVVNEEQSAEHLEDVKRELTLKMYTEDFIEATMPIKHRIHALQLGQKRMLENALNIEYPGAAGIAKCISCSRGANLAGTLPPVVIPQLGAGENTSAVKKGGPGRDTNLFTSLSEEVSKFPDVDFYSPPAKTTPTVTDPLVLPYLFAKAKPHVGLAHRKSRNVINREIDSYFATKPVRSIGGVYTKTGRQQHGVVINDVTLPATKKNDLTLIGTDKNVYKGVAIVDDAVVDTGSSDPQKNTGSRKKTANISVKKDSPVIATRPTTGFPGPIADETKKSASIKKKK